VGLREVSRAQGGFGSLRRDWSWQEAQLYSAAETYRGDTDIEKLTTAFATAPRSWFATAYPRSDHPNDALVAA
jgi:hypothetical protein